VPLIRQTSLFLLLILTLLTLVMSQLDNVTTGKVYTAAFQMIHLDLKTLNIDAVQISDNGHILAGFVLGLLAQLCLRRWWAISLVLGFVVCIELAQFLSAERQASFADVLRGWGGVGGAWFLLLCCVGEKRKANQGRAN